MADMPTIGLSLIQGAQKSFRSYIYAQVVYLKACAFKHHSDDLLADVVKVALYCAYDDLASDLFFSPIIRGLSRSSPACMALADMRTSGNEHFSFFEQFSYHIHTRDQTLFQDFQRVHTFG